MVACNLDFFGLHSSTGPTVLPRFRPPTPEPRVRDAARTPEASTPNGRSADPSTRCLRARLAGSRRKGGRRRLEPRAPSSGWSALETHPLHGPRRQPVWFLKRILFSDSPIRCPFFPPFLFQTELVIESTVELEIWQNIKEEDSRFEVTNHLLLRTRGLWLSLFSSILKRSIV